jgi:GH15 family glucan-1,4-alpha-glucosidase
VIGGGSNWDYRFAWLRDASLIARGLSVATCADESRRYFEWMTRAAVSCRHSDHVQIVFGVEGERDLSEHELGHLAGYRGSRPVRLGNAAWTQKQLDVLGEVLECASLVPAELGSLEPFTASFLCQLIDRAGEQWAETDSSIWEGREGERNYLVSKLMCWVALDRGVALAPQLGASADAARWSAARGAVCEAILRRGWSNEIGAFTGAFDSDRLDVGALLIPIFGFLPADDPRVERTIAVLERELGDDGLLRRWADAEDGAFLLASFWLAECHARAGRVERAQAVFERAFGHANDLGLLAEEVDPSSGELLGNFPQAFTHVGVITAAQAITEARRDTADSSQ